MKQIILTMTLLLSILSSPATANNNESEHPIQAGNTIFGMTITQESIDDVDKLMMSVSDPMTTNDYITFQITAKFNVYGKYCERYKPELSTKTNQVVNKWTNDVNYGVSQTLANAPKPNASMNNEESSDLKTITRNVSITHYLDIEKNANPNIFCPSFIEFLETFDPNEAVNAFRKGYEGYRIKIEQANSP